MSFDLEEEVLKLMEPMPVEEFEVGMKRLAREAPGFFLEVMRLSLG